ncbi:S24 family peptidase [Rhizorhabdus wittichii]|uniref:S24 family peptidase n=1 Tax=Rhizorhabdus wittichii TaxID=160791 RepID=UPI000374ECD0|nr:S24/S26 family peptidase [Rhizorhabdus wittichii]
MDSDAIIAGLKRYNVPHERIASVLGRDRTAATKMLGGKRSVKMNEVEGLVALIAEYEDEAGESAAVRRATALADQFGEGLLIEYAAVEILPTYVGMGAGGTGDGERRQALLPRALLRELHAEPTDLLVIEVRGTSMEPKFKQGDQIIIDRRDRDPRHGGPFALFDGDTYILKNIEQLPGPEGRLRVFSAAEGFTDWFPAPGEVTIEGRPVWFARRL